MERVIVLCRCEQTVQRGFEDGVDGFRFLFVRFQKVDSVEELCDLVTYAVSEIITSEVRSPREQPDDLSDI